MATRHEAHDERAKLVGLVRDDLDREILEIVQTHEVRKGPGAVGLGPVPPRERRGVDRVVKVRMTDEHSGNVARSARVTVDHREVRKRFAA